MEGCKICGRKCKNKGLTTIGGQKACSVHCAINIIPLENDKCSQCGSPVFINDMYKVNGLMCCSLTCKEEAEERTKLRSQKKIKQSMPKSDFLEPYSKNDYENDYQNNYGNNEEKKYQYNEEMNSNKSNNNKKNNYTNVNVGPTNYALGPRDYNTNDYDVGPGDKKGNLYHGDSNFNNDYNIEFDEDDEDEAYGDYNESNYLREYGQHNYVQKNDGKSGDQMRELGMKANSGKDKPKNEIKQIVHQGNDINCDYCGFSIKAGNNAFVDNFGKIFDTNECFSNHFQGIPKPNFG